jgi:hypothetical protein
LLWSGLKGKSWSSVIRNLIAGKNPSTATTSALISTDQAAGIGASSGSGDFAPGNTSFSGGSAVSTSNAANKRLGQAMAASYGWATGAEWTALNNLVMSESGWSDTAANPTSDARGIAQNINGWSSDYQEGNARQQIAWLLSYVKSRYGDPIHAWQFHLANNWY